MKLFQRLLVAPAALGLLAPITASATEVNLNDVSDYSKSDIEISTNSFKPLSTKNPLLAGGEGLGQGRSDSDDFDADSFSATTVASFSADFAAGAVDGVPSNGQGAEGQDKLALVYGYAIDLSTSFTGDDSLDVTLAGGNSTTQLTELDLDKGTAANRLYVDGISYTFPVGDKMTVFVGDNVEGSLLYNTACVYGGQTDSLDDCGNASSALDAEFGAAAGASYTTGNLSLAFGYEGQNDGSGLGAKEGTDAIGAQLAYSGDNYGVSATIARIETSTTEDDTFTALNAYFAPDNANFPSVSVGYEQGHDGSVADDAADETTHFFVGIQWDELADGTFGASFGTKTPTVENADDLLMYEAFYAYSVTDGLTVTPIVYMKENSGATDSETGLILKSSFSF